MDLGISGRVALVAASGRGLGRATAERLAMEGAHVAICDKDANVLDEAREAVFRAGGGTTTFAYPVDLTDAGDIEELVANVQRDMGTISILITNSGGPPPGSFDDATDDKWESAYALTFLSAVRLTRACLPDMKEQGWGRIINFTSRALKEPISGLMISNAVRLAVGGMAKTLAEEVGSIRDHREQSLPRPNDHRACVGVSWPARRGQGHRRRRGTGAHGTAYSHWSTGPPGRAGSSGGLSGERPGGIHHWRVAASRWRGGASALSDLGSSAATPLAEPSPPSLSEAGQFWLLGGVWGSSYLFNAIGLRELGPFTLVMARLTLAACVLVLIVRVRRLKVPTDPLTLLKLAALGVLGSSIPDILVLVGQKTVPTGVTSLLNATNPLFTLVGAHLALRAERATAFGLLGILTGFAGVAVIVSHDVGNGEALIGSLAAPAAIVAASVLYGLGPVYVRRILPEMEPLLVAAGQMVFGSILATGSAVIFERPFQALTSASFDALFAVFWVGVLAQGFGFVVYYSLLRVRGAARTAMVIYVSPIVGVVLGAIFLGERPDARIGLGALLILSGIWLSNRGQGRTPNAAPVTP